MDEDWGGVNIVDPLLVGLVLRAPGSAVGKNEPGLVADELDDSRWPKIPPALVDLAVRDGRGEASGETLPKIGFDPWLVDLVTSPASVWGAAFDAPASDKIPAGAVIAGEAVEAGVSGAAAKLWLAVG